MKSRQTSKAHVCCKSLNGLVNHFV